MSPCSKNLDTQEDYWDKIGTFWNIDYIGSRHAVSPKLSLSRPRTGGVRSNFWQLSPKFTKFPKVAKSCQKLPKIIKFGNKILLKTVAIWLLIITSKAPLSVLEVIKSDKKSNIKLFAPVHV